MTWGWEKVCHIVTLSASKNARHSKTSTPPNLGAWQISSCVVKGLKGYSNMFELVHMLAWPTSHHMSPFLKLWLCLDVYYRASPCQTSAAWSGTLLQGGQNGQFWTRRLSAGCRVVNLTFMSYGIYVYHSTYSCIYTASAVRMNSTLFTPICDYRQIGATCKKS